MKTAKEKKLELFNLLHTHGVYPFMSIIGMNGLMDEIEKIYVSQSPPEITDEEVMVYFNNHNNGRMKVANHVPAMSRSDVLELIKWYKSGLTKRMGKEEKEDEIPVSNKCKNCGWPIALGEIYCSECLVEDDCAF